MRLTSREADKIAAPIGINTTVISQNTDIACKKNMRMSSPNYLNEHGKLRNIFKKKKMRTNLAVSTGLHAGSSCCKNLESENKIEEPN